MDDSPSNAPEWSVSELSGALKRTLEDAYGHVRVRAELGKVSAHSSGHVYLDLKDDKACLAGVIWRGQAAKLRFKPEMGLEVIATGKITTFAGQSKYQLIIDTLEPAGVGALLAQLEERKRRLAAEGLFDPARKQLIPFIPGVIGVVTSPTGAVIRDILHRLADRFPRHVLVWPVRVQGDGSAQEVAAAIRGFNALEPGGRLPRPDVLIVARGGGSIEDLWSFNEEIVVRAAAESLIPLISAVGHETDTTLIDFAADCRAPTPTAAAEMAVPVRAELLAGVADLSRRMAVALRRHLDQNRVALRSAARALPGPDTLLAQPRQRVDAAGARLGPALAQGVRRHEQRVAQLGTRLARLSPQVRLAGLRARLDGLGQRLSAARAAQLRAEALKLAQRRDRVLQAGARADRALGTLIHRRRDRLDAAAKLLVSYSFQGVLARGFALVQTAEGGLVRAAAEVSTGQALGIRFADGTVKAVAGGERPRAKARESAPSLGQKSLFDAG